MNWIALKIIPMLKLRIPRSLHRLLAEHSQREGISMNQYCVYLRGMMRYSQNSNYK